MGRRVSVGVIVISLGLTACGGDDDGGSAAATDTTEVSGDTSSSGDSATVTTGDADADDVDPCGLVSQEDVSAIIGTEVVTVPQPSVSGGAVCHWERPGDGFYTVRLTVGPASLYDTLRSNVATDLDGVGDDAWSAFVGQIDIGVRVGAYNLLLFFDAPDGVSDTDALERAVQLAEAMLAGLEA